MAKVLIVDDSEFQRRVLGNTLETLGHEVISSKNGQEGIETALARKPDIIIVDLLMPGFDGIWVLSQVRERQIPIPVIVVTSDVQTTTKEKCLSLGAVAFLNKPARPDELTAAISLGLSGEKG